MDLIKQLAQEFKTIREMIQESKADSSQFTEIKSATVEVEVTEMEISQIEDEQMLTDHDIAIMELQGM